MLWIFTAILWEYGGVLIVFNEIYVFLPFFNRNMEDFNEFYGYLRHFNGYLEEF
jgi:hypothetical protein